MTSSSDERSWRDYYQKVAQRPVRPLLLQAVERFAQPGLAIDLGCGGGIESQELLRRGWQVVAMDQEAAALEAVVVGLSVAEQARLTVQRASFATLTLPAADFIWAGLSLPFCGPTHFPRLWETVTQALRPGGRFAGDLFGVRHAWRENPDMTFLTRAEVESYLQPFVVELLEEREEERQTAFQGRQHWHGFDIIARKA